MTGSSPLVGTVISCKGGEQGDYKTNRESARQPNGLHRVQLLSKHSERRQHRQHSVRYRPFECIYAVAERGQTSAEHGGSGQIYFVNKFLKEDKHEVSSR